MIEVILAVVVFSVGFVLGHTYKNKSLNIKVTHENIVDYKNFPENVKVDLKQQFEQAQEFSTLMENMKKMATNPNEINIDNIDEASKQYAEYLKANGGGI